MKAFLIKIAFLLYLMLSPMKNECEEQSIVESMIFLDIDHYSLPTDSEIKDLLNMTAGEIENSTGSKMENMLSILPFPVIYSKNTSYWFVCSDWDMNQKPLFLAFYKGCEEEYLSSIGLDDADNFLDIMTIMGNTEVLLSRTGDEMPEIKNRAGDYTYYKIQYEKDGLFYVFISDHPEGKEFTLYIGLSSYSTG